MTCNNEKASNKVNPVATGLAGVVIGAGVVAAATALKDKKTQQKVKQALKFAGKTASVYISKIKIQAEKLQEEPEGNIKDNTEKVKKEVKKTAPGTKKKVE